MAQSPLSISLSALRYQTDYPGIQLLLCINLFARTAITQHHGLGGSNNRNLFPPTSGGSKPKTKVSVDLVSPEAPLWLTDGCPLTVSSYGCPSAHHPSVSSIFYEDISPIRWGGRRPKQPHFNSITSFKDYIPKYQYILRNWEIRLQQIILGEKHNSAPNTLKSRNLTTCLLIALSSQTTSD